MQDYRKSIVGLIILASTTFVSCTNNPLVQTDDYQTISGPDRLKRLSGMNSGFGKKKKMEKAGRFLALETTAFEVGLYEGVYWRNQQIMEKLESQEGVLNRVFPFGPFMIDGRALMPVVLQTQRAYHQESKRKVRQVRVSYTLDKSAKFVSVEPNWRDYLIRPLEMPDPPHESLLPKTLMESRVWSKGIKEGWEQGVELANEAWVQDVRVLRNDYVGMQNYRKLLAQGIVTLPEISRSDLGIVKNGKTLNVNDVVYEITLNSDFTEIEQWSPIFKGGKNR